MDNNGRTRFDAVAIAASIRRTLRIGAAIALAALAIGVTAQERVAGEAYTVALPMVVPGEFNGDLSRLPYSPVVTSLPNVFRPRLPGPPRGNPNPVPETVSPSLPSFLPSAPMPGPLTSFLALSKTDSCTGGTCGGGWPPDTNGDVGPNHYILTVNSAVAIYNKTGTQLAAFTENNLWLGVGSTPCNGNSQGDPVALYDWLADRFVVTWFAFGFSMNNPVSPYYQCIAASKTSDPVAGGWWLYAVRMDTGATPLNTLQDYGKFGLWHDCLYMSANGFLNANSYNGVLFASFSRADMYSGAPLTSSIGFLPYPANNVYGMLPSNNNGKGANAVQAGTPNYFVMETFANTDFEVRKFTAGPNCGAGGTLGAPTFVAHAPITFQQGNIVPQPNTSTKLDMIDDRLMQKAQYRKVAGVESVWVTHSVKNPAGSNTATQWAQIDVTGGTVAATPIQQQIYSPDTSLYRFMSSLAVDQQGNMALGFSTSNGSSPNFPSIAYAGRLATDPLGTLPQTEVQLVAGGGSQNNTCGGSPCDRWGDYSSMSVDPADDCTFWYTNEYYDNQTSGNSGNWRIRIGSFKFPTCANPIIAPTVTTGAAGSLGTTTATLNGTVTSNGATTTASFQYGLTVAYGSSVAATQSPLAAGVSNAAVSAPITALTCNTVYHFRAVGVNSVNTTNGNDATFTTAACPILAPTVTTGAASAITVTGGTLNGTVSSNGASSAVTFQYGLTTAYGSLVTATQSPLAAGASNAAVSAPIAGLTCNTLYHFRARGVNSVNTTNGLDAIFTTAACAPTAPAVTTSAASAVTVTGATLNGIVSSNGASTAVIFEYGLTAAYGSGIAAVQSPLPAGASNAAVSTPVAGLTCNTLYHFRAVGVNSVTNTNGSDAMFTTGACPILAPTVTTNAASAITGTGATLNGTVSSNGATTTVSFEYGATTAYGAIAAAAQSPLAAGAANVPVSAAVDGFILHCGSLYHYRAVGSNSAGPTNGADATFTTGPCTLTVQLVGAGGGSVMSTNRPGINCGGDCSETYAVTSFVNLAQTAFPGSSFAGWGGGTCVDTGECGVSMNAPITVNAMFNYNGTVFSFDYVQKVYVAYYGRPSEPPGQAYWAGQMDLAGGSIDAIIDAFGNSNEFNQRYGGLSNSALVTKIYQQTLARDPEPAGLAFYVGELDAGRRTLQSIALDVLNGATTPPDSTVVANKLNVAAYFTAKVALGCHYGTELDGVNFLSGVNATPASVTAAKAAIDARCGP